MDEESGSDEEREISALTASIIALESDIDAAKARTDARRGWRESIKNTLEFSTFTAVNFHNNYNIV